MEENNVEVQPQNGIRIMQLLVCFLVAWTFSFFVSLSTIFLCHHLESFTLPSNDFYRILCLFLGPGSFYWAIYIKCRLPNKYQFGLIVVLNVSFFIFMLIGFVINELTAIFFYDYFAKKITMLWS